MCHAMTLGDLSTTDYGYTQTAPPLSGGAISVSDPAVIAERIPVSDDTDELTKTTIAKMCEYIAKGMIAPNVVAAARYAAHAFAGGRRDPQALAWGVFWFLKHRVRRVLDEGNMFRIGEPGASDLLIAPDALLAMPNPSEDCDGFTMAAAAMLGALGVQSCIVTVACDPREPRRWSHVFGMVEGPNGWFPLDCSHGTAPGWMVPRSRISRWQAWDLSGNPINIDAPAVSPLRGYVSRRGMGQDCSDPTAEDYDANCLGISDITSPTPISTGIDPNTGDTIVCPSGYSVSGANCVDAFGNILVSSPTGSGSPSVSLPAGSTSSSSGINWNALLAEITGAGARVATVAELPAGASLTPSGAVIGSVASSISSMLPLLLLAVGAVVVISLLEGARK